MRMPFEKLMEHVAAVAPAELDLLDNLGPELRYAVQFCPDCRRWGKWDEYLLCPVHAGIRLGREEAP